MVRGSAMARNAALRSFLLAVCGFIVVAPLVQAQDREVPVLRIGTSGDYAPFSETVEGSQGYRGFDISLAEAFARDRGYEIEWVKFRWPELAADMRSGRFDLAMSGITVRPDRSVIGRFSVPVMTSGAVLLYSVPAFEDGAQDQPRSAESAATSADALTKFDRPGLRIAVNRGGHLERVARAHFERATIRSITDNAAVRQALIDAEADAVVTDSLEAPGWRRGLSQVATFGPFTRDRKAYWVAPGRDALSRELDAWLMTQELDGTLDRLRRSAFGDREHEQTASPLAALLAAIDERLALMPWVAESKRRNGTPIEDLAQEIRVLEASHRSVQAAAKRAGTTPPSAAAVTSFYRAQIEAAKAIQRRTLKGRTHRSAEASDLKERLRPALIRIGDRLAQLIVALHRRPDAVDLVGEVERSLRARDLDGDSLDEIRRAITAITADAK
ncbi:MAG: transporter substrate-binding domain-containing protein [Deltaproteobacteria bacterium]|nr:transporter substrate-binding domain-containing protein [Deltaproteobacteria bacterium]MBW2723234.1 transporter substrate-binding domain-containing protein [Deltaproteobacteria bacterium]